jgi:hypothetical protein
MIRAAHRAVSWKSRCTPPLAACTKPPPGIKVGPLLAELLRKDSDLIETEQ